jgi:hypothetical protein
MTTTSFSVSGCDLMKSIRGALEPNVNVDIRIDSKNDGVEATKIWSTEATMVADSTYKIVTKYMLR